MDTESILREIRFTSVKKCFRSVLDAVGERIAKGSIEVGDTSVDIVTVPANSIVTDVFYRNTTNWNGSPTIKFGDAADDDGFFTSASASGSAMQFTSGSSRGAYLWNSSGSTANRKFYPEETDLTATITSGSTTGAADIFVKFFELP
jgi:hypothetical protein